MIEEYRESNKWIFKHDEVLSGLLVTALANYEVERVTGCTFCEEEFTTAIKGYIPTKHTFKAFPIQVTTLQPHNILQQLCEQPKAL